MEGINMKRLRIESENLKNDNGRMIVLPTIVISIDTEPKEFSISIGILWYAFSIVYYYGKNLDC
jgi:hypothetical protein